MSKNLLTGDVQYGRTCARVFGWPDFLEVGRRSVLDDNHIHNRVLAAGVREVLKASGRSLRCPLPRSRHGALSGD